MKIHRTEELAREHEYPLKLSLEPEEIASLPESCRPGRFVDAEDVGNYALQLARAQCDSGVALVNKLAAFMTNASLRLAQIMARASEVSSETVGLLFAAVILGGLKSIASVTSKLVPVMAIPVFSPRSLITMSRFATQGMKSVMMVSETTV